MKTLASLALLGLVAVGARAHAAESYDNCAGFIDTVPTTITSQGVWCLRKDLATGIASGAAITIATNNVTIDCNDFKIGGLAAGTATATRGIVAANRQNLRVRNCNIRGFHTGIDLDGGGGHLVEDNNFNGNLSVGLRVSGDGSIVRRNAVIDTGGSTLAGNLAMAIGVVTVYNVDTIDNTIDGVLATGDGGNKSAIGIQTQSNAAGTISGNRVRGALAAGTGTHAGITNVGSGRIAVVDNILSGSTQANGTGLSCANNQGTAVRNIVNGYPTGIVSCTDSGGNVHML